MKLFRILLTIIFLITLIYTFQVGKHYGWDLLPIFFGELSSLNWNGQFNLDFFCHLILSGLWIAWRNKFSLKGCILGFCGLVGGILFTAPYILFLSFTNNGNVKDILIGKN